MLAGLVVWLGRPLSKWLWLVVLLADLVVVLKWSSSSVTEEGRILLAGSRGSSARSSLWVWSSLGVRFLGEGRGREGVEWCGCGPVLFYLVVVGVEFVLDCHVVWLGRPLVMVVVLVVSSGWMFDLVVFCMYCVWPVVLGLLGLLEDVGAGDVVCGLVWSVTWIAMLD